MAPAVAMRDAQQVVRTVLAGLTPIIVARVPNPRPTEFLLGRRLGGIRRDLVSDAPILTIEAWAATDVAAHDLLAAARLRIAQAGFTVVDVDGTPVSIYGVAEIGGPVPLPDPDSGHDRWTYTVQLRIRGDA